MSARVTLFQYRNLLRLAKQENLAVLGASPALNQAAIATLCPPATGLKFFGSPTVAEPSTVADVIRASFRECADLDDERQIINAQHRAHNAIQFLNRITHQFRDKLDRSGVEHHIGQIVLHKDSGIHFVVVGWDRECKNPQSVPESTLQDGHEQPFYHVLPHRLDCERRRIPLSTAYLPQEFLVMSPRPFLSNPKIGEFFDRYCSETQRFVPKPIMAQMYPDESYPQGDVDLEKYVKTQAKRQSTKRKQALQRYAQQGQGRDKIHSSHQHVSHSHALGSSPLGSSGSFQKMSSLPSSTIDSNSQSQQQQRRSEYINRISLSQSQWQQLSQGMPLPPVPKAPQPEPSAMSTEEVSQVVAATADEHEANNTSTFLEAAARHGESSLRPPSKAPCLQRYSRPNPSGAASLSDDQARSGTTSLVQGSSGTVLVRAYKRPTSRKRGGSRLAGMRSGRRSGHTQVVHRCSHCEILDPMNLSPGDSVQDEASSDPQES